MELNILGVQVTAIGQNATLQWITDSINTATSSYLCLCNVHTIMCAYRDPILRRKINQAALVLPDGMPLVWIGKWTGHYEIERVYGPELMLSVCENLPGLRHYFYGGETGVPEKLADSLKRHFPSIILAGCHSPPFRELTQIEQEKDIARIRETQPDIVWVGLGTPRQDHWVADHCHQLPGTILIPVGAAFDFLTGRQPQAPQWMRNRGLEWFFRLTSEPGRLWRRYLIDNPIFVLLYILQVAGIRKPPSDGEMRR
jgi:N-acetylglucosaminyldiphosphoundecaprenol N-acetyl-beta-D-mannosaminyltransferase